MARVFIVEDEMIIREKLIILLETLGHVVSGSCDNADIAFAMIRKSDAEVILLDIGLPGKNNGISLGSQINKETDLPFIFITSFQDKETIGEAADTHPVTYLTKPVQKGDLAAAIELALHSRKTTSEKKSSDMLSDTFYARVGDKLSKVEIADILWFNAADANYCDLMLRNGRQISIRSSLLRLLSQLPSGLFIQIHRQYAVNIKEIEQIQLSDHMVYIAGRALPLGRSFKDDLLKKIERL